MKKIFLLLIGATLFSCSDFLDTAPKDQLASTTFWKDEGDAYKALVGCYSGAVNAGAVFFWDCTSDIGFDFHPHEGYRGIANGGEMTAASIRLSEYSYTTIRRCNNFLANIEKIPFKDEKLKKNYTAQVRAIRALRYAWMNMWYGGVPLANGLYTTADEAQLPKNTEKEVYDFIQSELAAAVPDLDKTVKPGYIGQGMALAIKMRSALWMNDYANALDAATKIQALGIYDLDPSYSNLFATTNNESKEIIYRRQFLSEVATNTIIFLYNNADGGWSSTVPTSSLLDMYEMENGLTKEEAGSGYDAQYPFAGRDPRMAATLLYPGMDWNGRILNTLDKKIKDKEGKEIDNPDYPGTANNSSKTGLSWGKYTRPMWAGNQESTNVSPIEYRYAEVLLTIAECHIEKDGGDLGLATDMLDEIRDRAGMPLVDRAKYSSKEALRELLRRERCVELAGEGLRRADIVRWKDANGKLVAETVLAGKKYAVSGTIVANADPEKRAQITSDPEKMLLVDEYVFKPEMRYFPFTQGSLDQNPKLIQNAGYL